MMLRRHLSRGYVLALAGKEEVLLVVYYPRQAALHNLGGVFQTLQVF